MQIQSLINYFWNDNLLDFDLSKITWHQFQSKFHIIVTETETVTVSYLLYFKTFICKQVLKRVETSTPRADFELVKGNV